MFVRAHALLSNFCSAPVVGAVNALTALAAATGTPAEALPLVTKWLEVAIKNAYVPDCTVRVRTCCQCSEHWQRQRHEM